MSYITHLFVDDTQLTVTYPRPGGSGALVLELPEDWCREKCPLDTNAEFLVTSKRLGWVRRQFKFITADNGTAYFTEYLVLEV